MPHKKMGRPPLKHPLIERLYLRVDERTKSKLDACTDALHTSRSDIVRQEIEKVYGSLKK